MSEAPATTIEPSPEKASVELTTIPNTLTNRLFVKVLVAIIASWILIHVWSNALDVFAYDCLGLNRRSALHTTGIAVVATCLFLVYVNCCGNEGSIIQTRMTGVLAQPVAGEDGIIG